VFFITSNNSQHLLWGTSVVVAPMVAEGIKRISCVVGITKYYKWANRPVGACDCDTWNRNGPRGGTPGFPSGHSAVAAAFWVGAVLLYKDWRTMLMGYAGILVMVWARLNKRCHTLFQTMGGTVLGAGVATGVLGWYRNSLWPFHGV